MRQIKLPHLPSDVEARKGDYMTDLTPAEEYERIQMARQYSFEQRDRCRPSYQTRPPRDRRI